MNTILEFLKNVIANAETFVLGALILSAGLKALDKCVEFMGERHPASRFWPTLDHILDAADSAFGWFGELMRNVVFTRKSL